MVWLRQPAPITSACHGGVVGCGNQAWRIAIVGQDSQVSCIAHNDKSLPLEEKVANVMSRMRCSRRSGVILYSFANGCFAAYTSPPPTAEPLLKEKPFGESTFQLSPIAAQRFCSYSTRPRGSGQRSWTPGRAQHDQGGKQEANGGKLAFIRAVQAFTCHGAQNGSPAFQFNSIDFHVTHRFFVTFFTEESNVFFRLPPSPSSPSPQIRNARLSGRMASV